MCKKFSIGRNVKNVSTAVNIDRLMKTWKDKTFVSKSKDRPRQARPGQCREESGTCASLHS